MKPSSSSSSSAAASSSAASAPPPSPPQLVGRSEWRCRETSRRLRPRAPLGPTPYGAPWELPHLRPALGHQLVDVQPVGAEGCEGCCQPEATPPAPPEGVAAAVRTPVEACRAPVALTVHSAEALDLLRRPARMHQPARHSPLELAQAFFSGTICSRPPPPPSALLAWPMLQPRPTRLHPLLYLGPYMWGVTRHTDERWTPVWGRTRRGS
jgi:hypothetical protein